MRLSRLSYFIEKHSRNCEDEQQFHEFMFDIDQAVQQVSETASMLTVHRMDQNLAAERDWKAKMLNWFYFGLGGILSWLVL